MGTTTRTTIGLLTLATVALGACSTTDDAAFDEAPAEEAAPPPLADEEFAVDVGEAESDDAASSPDAARTGSLDATGVAVADFGRDIITEIELTMATDDVARTADDIRRLTVANGGAVFSSEVTIGEPLDDGAVPGSGRIVVRIPPADLERLVSALDGLGGVTRVAQDSEDVTDQLVDLEIRIRQAETGIRRIEEILAVTTELDDLFAIESELGRRQVELERLLAARRTTEDRVALATLTIDVEFRHDVEPTAVAEPEDEGIADAFRSGWDAFVGALFTVAFVLAVLSPFLAVAAVVGIVALVAIRRLRRGRRTGTTTIAPAGRPAAEVDERRADAAISDRVDEPSPTA